MGEKAVALPRQLATLLLPSTDFMSAKGLDFLWS